MKHPDLFKKSSAGFSLIEIMIALSILGILTIGVSSNLLNITRAQKSAEGNSNAIEIQKLILNSFAGKNKISDTNCATVLSLTSAPQFNTANGRTNVSVAAPGLPAITAGAVISVGSQMFNVNQVYLTDNVLVSTASGGTTQMYISSLFVEVGTGSLDALMNKRRNIGTMSVTLENGVLRACNTKSLSMTSSTTCGNISGVSWSPTLGRCVSYLPPTAGGGGSEIDCPPGTWRRADSLCVPVASDCGSGRVARGFRRGRVATCSTAAIGPAVGLTPPPSLPAIPPALPTQAANVAPTPPTAPTNPYTPPLATQNVTAPSPPPAPPASCVNGTTVNETNYNLCENGSAACELNAYTPANNTCGVQENLDYATPNLASTPPSVAPPADNSCMCNNRRISDGEYCMYCVEDINFGWGYHNYVYGVSQCSSGVLNDIPNPIMNTSGGVFCSNTYGRAQRVGPIFEQIP